MLIDQIKRMDSQTLLVQLSDIHKVEFAAEFAAEDRRYIEEFSLELIQTIRKKYPKFKKGTIKIIAGTVVVATLQVSGAQLTVNANPDSSIVIPIGHEDRFSMSYLYFGSADAQIDALEASGNSLNVVSPSYFDLESGGQLKITSLYQKRFVDTAHKKGIKVVPFLSNHWDRQLGVEALENRENLAQQIADAVKRYNLDGVNVDIENVTHNQRDQYTDFVRRLREKLPAGKEVSVAVAANPYSWNTGWHGSYDYEKLAEVSDYLMIMAYDEHYQGGPEGPVSSIGFMEKSIEYALRFTSPDKIVVGLPFFGRYWRAGAESGGQGISLSTAQRLFSQYPTSHFYDPVAKSPKATVTIRDNDIKPVVNGKTLNAGTYTIWYEDDSSLREKLLLVSKYGIKGAGSWSLGQEHQGVWDYYTKWLGGVYFADIASNWAREEIMDAVLNGDMKGVNSVAFEPNRTITRAEFVTLLLRKFGIPVIDGSGGAFSDTAGHWAEDEIAAAVNAGIAFGTGDNKFHPNRAVTRQEAASLLARVMKLTPPQTAKPPFWDISYDNPARADIEAVVEAGIFRGFSDGSFKPQQGMTRAETAVISGRIPNQS